MAMRGKFEVTGLKELYGVLRQLEPATQKRVVRKALKAAADPILHAARSKAPIKSGLLVSTLMVRSASSKRKGTITARVQTKQGDFKGEGFYAPMVEFGHFAGPRKLGANRVHVPAHPFMRPAYDENKETALATFKSIAGKAIEAEARKLGKQVLKASTA